MVRGAWSATVSSVTKSRTWLKWLSTHACMHIYKLPNVWAGFGKGRGTRDQIANIHWIMEKAREFQKIIYFCFIDMSKPLTVWITINWKILKEMGIQDLLTCLLRNLYAGQEATETDMEQRTGSKLGKEYLKVVYCHSAYLTYMAEYLMWNAGLDEAQAGIKTARRNINNL